MILRHSTDTSNYLWEEGRSFNIDQLSLLEAKVLDLKPVDFSILKSIPFDIVQSDLFNLKTNEIRNYLDLHLDFGLIHFKRHYSIEELIVVEFSGKLIQLSKIEATLGIDYFSWFNLMSIALLTRNKKHIQYLLYIRPEILDESGFWLLGCQLMDKVLKREAESCKELIQRIEQIAHIGKVQFISHKGSSSTISKKSAKILTTLWLPIFKLYYLVAQNDESGFNEEMEQFILSKKKYIIKKKEERDRRYWFDFPLMGCCALAHDRGMKITVESEYTPLWLIRNEDQI